MSEKLKKTGIPGLDFLLNDEFRIPFDRSLNILVRGNVGAGKTTFSLQMGVNFAKKGVVGVYYALEQSLRDLKETVDGFNWVKGGPPPVIAYSSEDSFSTKLEELKKSVDNKGGLLFTNVPKENIGSLTDFISRDISKAEKLLEREVQFIVIDSISAVGQGDILRSSFKDLIDKFSDKNDCVVITTLEEQGSPKFQSEIEDFLVDVVIRLGCRYRTDRKDYIERFIEIIKYRNQSHQRGRHPFSIINPKDYAEKTEEKEGQIEGGIYIYPSLAATLSSLAKKEFEGEVEKPLSTGLPELDKLLPKTKIEEKTESREICGIWEGSCCVLIGERGTKKTVMGLHFLAEGVRKGEKCLLLSLKNDKYTIKKVAKEYKFLRENLLSDQECSSFLKIEYIPVSYLTPEKFIDYVKKWIDEERDGKGQNQIKRVLFDNIGQIKLKFPLLEVNPTFVPALIELFKKEGITSLFIDVVEEPERAILEYKSPILDLADYVIATQHLPFLGRDHTVITVRRSREGGHDAEPAEVRREGGEGGKIVIDPFAFESITGVLVKNPEPAEISVKLFYENKIEKDFNEEIKREFIEKYEKKVHVNSFSRDDLAEEYGRIKRYWIEAPRSIVKVVSLDEYWVKHAAHEGILRKIDKGWFIKEQGKDWLKKEKKDFLSKSLKPAEVNGELYAIPNYLSLGLFCYRKDLFEKLFGEKTPPPNDFNELIKLLQQISKSIRERGLWGFGFEMEVEESVVCTFLEFLYNTSTSEGKAGKKFHDISDKGEREPLILSDDKDVKEAAIRALETMRSLEDDEIMPYPCTLDRCKDTIFSRQWYSTLQYIYYDCWHQQDNKGELILNDKGEPIKKEKYKEAKFAIMKFPVIKGKKGDKNKKADYYSCSGSWYLGILKESLRSKLGYHLIDEMTSISKNLRRYELGAGFPVRKSFYKFHGWKNVKNVENLTYKEVMDSVEGEEECHRKLCRRGSICGNNVELYCAILPDIANIVLSVLEGTTEPKKAVNKMIRVIKEEKRKLDKKKKEK